MAPESLFYKFTGLINYKNKKNGGSTLSANQALDAQRDYVSADNKPNLAQLSPYSEIVKQLYSPKTEIVAAALYYLQKIAANEPTATEGILAELNNCLNTKNKITAAHKVLIAQALNRLTATQQ